MKKGRKIYNIRPIGVSINIGKCLYYYISNNQNKDKRETNDKEH